MQTDVYEVHIHQVAFASIDIQPHTTRDKYYVGNDTFWGITTDWDDYLTRQLWFTPTDDATSEKVLRQKRWMYDPVNDLVVGVNFNFVEQVTENKYR